MPTRGCKMQSPECRMQNKRLANRPHGRTGPLALSLILLASAALAGGCVAPRGPAMNGLMATTGQGVPSDPINVVLVGSRADVEAAMKAARWQPADPMN